MPPRHEDMMNLFSFRMVLVLINTAIHQVFVRYLSVPLEPGPINTANLIERY